MRFTIVLNEKNQFYNKHLTLSVIHISYFFEHARASTHQFQNLLDVKNQGRLQTKIRGVKAHGQYSRPGVYSKVI